MSRRTKRSAGEATGWPSLEDESDSLDRFVEKEWSSALNSNWAKRERLWTDKAKFEGYDFKSPAQLGYMSEYDAGKRYTPTLNSKGEWVLPDVPPIHRSSDIPMKRPVAPSKPRVAAEKRAAANKELREQAKKNGGSAAKTLPEPMERRQRLQKKRAAAAATPSEPTRRSARVRDQSVQANASASMPSEAVGAVGVTESRVTALVPTSENARAPSNTSASSAATAPIAAAVSTQLVSIPTVAAGPKARAAPTVPPAPAAPAKMQVSNDVLPDKQPENPVAPVSFLQGSHSNVAKNEVTSQASLVTWKMDAALAGNVQSILSAETSIKQEDEDGKSNKAVAGKKRKAVNDEDDRPAKKPAHGKIVNDKKRKAEDQSGPAKKRSRVTQACKGCQHWRVKCDGASPCASCQKRGIPCVYDRNEDTKGDDSENDGAAEPECDEKPPRSLAGHVSTKKASANRTAAAMPSKKPAVGRTARGPSCNMCREKKTGCSREKPCSNCRERGWNCVYEDPQTTNQAKKPSSGSGSGSGASGSKPSGAEHKNSNAESSSSRQFDGPSGGSSAQQMNDAAENTSNLGDHASEPVQDWHNKSSKIRTILPAISEWSVEGEHGFHDYKFNMVDCLTKRQLEKREMPAEENKNFELGTNAPHIQEESFHSRPSIKLVLPDHLKGFLVDDWENVTKNGLLVELPHSKATVDQILKDYVEYEKQHRQEGSAHMDILIETIEGLREYFDKALARILLYR